MAKTKILRVGPDFRTKDFAPGYVLTAKNKGIQYRIVKVTKDRIVAQIRKGTTGRWQKKLVDVVVPEVLGFAVHPPAA